MTWKNIFTKILAIAGAALVWFPVLMPILLAGASLITGQGFRLDFLMPAEFFPLALAGGGLLLWAALRARSQQRWIGWSLASAVVFLVAGQAYAIIIGEARGSTGLEGGPLLLVLASLAVYTAALIALGIAGIILIKQLWRSGDSAG